MSLSKTSLHALGVTLALIGFAYAQGGISEWDFKERGGILLTPTGNAKLMQGTDAGHAMMMKEGKALGQRHMIYMSGGKLYLLADHKMADGSMMFDQAGAWMFGGR